MDATLKLKVSEIFLKYNFSKEDAGFISEVLDEIDDRQQQKFEVSKELFLTQKDKVELIDIMQKIESSLTEKINSNQATLLKAIYISGLVQFLAIIGAFLAIFNFMIK